MLCETFHTEVSHVNWEVTVTNHNGIIYVHLCGLRSLLMNGLTVTLCWSIGELLRSWWQAQTLKAFVDDGVSSYKYNIQMVSAVKSI